MSHDFESGIGIGTKLKFHPVEKSNGDAGNFFDKRKLSEKELKINYNQDITDRFSIEPGMSFTIKDDEENTNHRLVSECLSRDINHEQIKLEITERSHSAPDLIASF
ncbi:MAG: oligogalacturonate-specific porin KdgM family protein [Enterobacteriaceae bacterium]|nr:oligogalacturonate-specific porin KdgM family protein [Enterobacteriaceae bacterium]